MTCILCLERIKNPHCFPELSTIVLGVVVYFCSNIIYICIKIIILILKGMFWILKNKIKLIQLITRKCIKSQTKENTREFKPLNKKSNKTSYESNCCFNFLLYFNQKCSCLTSLQADDEKCTVNKHGERSCTFEKILE